MTDTTQLRRFLNMFPTDAKSWADATDEPRDVARYIRELYEDQIEKQVTPANINGAKTPAERNKRAHIFIKKYFKLLNDKNKKEVLNYISEIMGEDSASKMAKGGKTDSDYQESGIGFIPIDIEEKFALLGKWGGVDVREVIEYFNAMVDAGITDADLQYQSTKNTRFQRERAVESKIKEIYAKVQPKYKGSRKGGYYSLFKELIGRNWIYEGLLERFKPYRKNQKFAKGGQVGDMVNIQDSKSLYNGLSGVITGEVGNDWVVKTTRGTGLVSKSKVKVNKTMEMGGKTKGIPFKPYGKIKGSFSISYIEDGEPQSEIWESMEMAMDRVKRLKKMAGVEKVKLTKKNKMAEGGKMDRITKKYNVGGGVGLGTNYNFVYEKPNSDIAWKETINANSIKEAKEKFKSKHPNCNILNISEEYANGGGVGSSNSWNYTIGGL